MPAATPTLPTAVRAKCPQSGTRARVSGAGVTGARREHPAHRPKEEDVWAVYPHRWHVPLKVKLAIEHMQHEFQSRPTMMAAHLST